MRTNLKINELVWPQLTNSTFLFHTLPFPNIYHNHHHYHHHYIALFICEELE
jgi:hypothetical protein